MSGVDLPLSFALRVTLWVRLSGLAALKRVTALQRVNRVQTLKTILQGSVNLVAFCCHFFGRERDRFLRTSFDFFKRLKISQKLEEIREKGTLALDN
jgi:hypothetical protein